VRSSGPPGGRPKSCSSRPPWPSRRCSCGSAGSWPGPRFLPRSDGVLAGPGERLYPAGSPKNA
jgi:hypothetical protein